MKNNFDVKYQFTKVAQDLYNVYDSSKREGEFKNTKELCDFLIQKRGGISLNQEMYDILSGAENGHTFGICESALTINKVAKAHGIEPWKLAEVDGQEVFVSASTGLEVDEDDKKLNKKASLNRTAHTYKVAIKTGALAKTTRAYSVLTDSGYTDEDMYINPASPDSIVLNVTSEEVPSKVLKEMLDLLNGGFIGLSEKDLECCHDYCECGETIFDYPDMLDDDFVLIVPNNNPMFAKSAESLRDYATANNFSDFKVCAADGSSVYDSAMKDAIKEIDEAMPQEKQADLSTNPTVFEDTNTGEVFTQEQLDADPNKKDRTLKPHTVSAQYINDMFKESSTVELSLANKNILRSAVLYLGFEKLAFLSEDSFSIKAGDAVVTVDNNKATMLPFGLYLDSLCKDVDCVEKEEDTDSIL